MSIRDRWGATPADEANRVGATDVAAYLNRPTTREAAVTAARHLAGLSSSSGSSRFGTQAGSSPSSMEAGAPAGGGVTQYQ